MLSIKEREPELWVVVISYMDNKDKRQKMVLPNFFSRNIGGIYIFKEALNRMYHIMLVG